MASLRKTKKAAKFLQVELAKSGQIETIDRCYEFMGNAMVRNANTNITGRKITPRRAAVMCLESQ